MIATELLSKLEGAEVTEVKKKFDIGPGVTLELSDTEDEYGFSMNLVGTFRSGNDMKKTCGRKWT